MKYNYVIFWSEWELYEQSFADLFGKSYACYVNSPVKYMTKFQRNLYQLQHSDSLFWRRLGRVLGCQFYYRKEKWYPVYFRNEFEEKKPLVFIFAKQWIGGEFDNYVTYLRKIFPDARFVLFLADLAMKNGGMNIGFAKSAFDLILSFDQNDCEKYGFVYHPLVFSKYSGEVADMPYNDVYFLGQGKDRFSDIISCLEKLWENDVTTDIQLIWVRKEEQVYQDRITYHDNMIPYQTNLQHFIHANCALELMQHGGVGYTQRMCEAIAFDKKIITNNALVHKAPFYNPNFIYQIKSAADITPEICQRIKTVEPVDYHYKEQISPLELLQFIEDKL